MASIFRVLSVVLAVVASLTLTGGPSAAADVAVRVNQHAYQWNGPKHATVVTDSTAPLSWQLTTSAGKVVAQGKTTVYGLDEFSGDHVHLVDFSRVTRTGERYRLVVAGVASFPFDIAKRPYKSLREDAFAYFYHNRSGIEIDAAYVGAQYARPAGHVGVAPNQGDTNVPCYPGSCDYSLDVRGGWYDAGDHGKYVVNGGISAWQLLDAYERAVTVSGGGRAEIADGTLRIPEAGNGVSDVLDEARWEVEFLLRMQVPAGQALAGMAHHKMHDDAWTGIPMRPDLDPRPRYLQLPSTAATLNLAAVAARCARLWKKIDGAFASKCRTAAETAWAAAVAHPAMYAQDLGTGGGGYGDGDVTDEFSWAAAELFTTTGRATYKAYLEPSDLSAGFYWGSVAALGDLTLARFPNQLSRSEWRDVRDRVVAGADALVADMHSQGYANPYLPRDGHYAWGSASATPNSAFIIASAFDLTGKQKYRDAALESMDYLFGRNALNQSYVSGYGEQASHNMHHRFWANQANAAYPNPPAGALAGGPNSRLEDPKAQELLQGCKPAKCYVDHIDSYSTNEVTINWNAPLAWMALFADSPSGRR